MMADESNRVCAFLTRWVGIGLLTASIAPAAASAQQAQPLQGPRLEELAQRYTSRSFPLLHELLSIPNDAHFAEHVQQNLDWMRRAFEARRFQSTLLPTGGPPLLLAEKQVDPALATILIYLQVDGQPVDPSQWSQEDPYRPVLREQREGAGRDIPWERLGETPDPDWRIFARSASDAKGPIVMFLTALDALDGEGLSPGFNLKVIMDFEEELGSPHLPSAVRAHRQALSADGLLILDGPRHQSNRPTLTFGARGIADITLTVFGPRVPQHSGHYGNYAPNPAQRLAQLLASMKDAEGRVVIAGFYDGVQLEESTRDLLRQTPDDEMEIREKMGIAAADRVAPTYQEAIQYPSLNVRGLASGWVGEQVRTIIPARATAEIDVRLVPEVNAERLIRLIRDHVKAQGYHLIEDRNPTEQERRDHPRLASFRSRIHYQAFRTAYDSPLGRWLTAAMTRGFGQPPVRIRMAGGSIPISPFVVELGVPAVSVPTVNPDNNQHSPNENLRLGNYQEGVKTFLAILTERVVKK